MGYWTPSPILNDFSQYASEEWYVRLGGANNPLAEAVLDRIIHDEYELRIEAIGPNKDISMRVIYRVKLDDETWPEISDYPFLRKREPSFSEMMVLRTQKQRLKLRKEHFLYTELTVSYLSDRRFLGLGIFKITYNRFIINIKNKF